MKTRLIMLFIAMASVFSLSAQQGSGPRQGRGPMTAEQRAEMNKKRIDNMQKDIDLTAAEKTKVEKLFKDISEKMSKLRSDNTSDSEKKREEMSKLRKEQQDGLKKIVGDERYAKYQKAEQERRKESANGKGNQSKGKKGPHNGDSKGGPKGTLKKAPNNSDSETK